MKKISQGKYEIFTTKQDAIDKFMQLQGTCREEISGENCIEFYCFENGKIIITNPPRRRIENENSTELFAEIIEQDGKTYVTFYTAFSQSNNVLKLIFLVIDIISAILAIAWTILNEVKIHVLIFLGLCLAFFVYKLFTASNEKRSSPDDSKIIIKELEKRVEAVNLWDR